MLGFAISFFPECLVRFRCRILQWAAILCKMQGDNRKYMQPKNRVSGKTVHNSSDSLYINTSRLFLLQENRCEQNTTDK